MAPTISSRSKQNSTTPSPIPQLGIALGLFAAIATGFAALRALRRKRYTQSLQDGQQSISSGNPPFKEREIEIKEGDETILFNTNGSITIAQEPSKLAAGSLKPVFDAIDEVSFVQQRDAFPLEERKGAEKGEEEDCEEGQKGEEAENGGDSKENEKKGEAMEKGESNEEEGETAEVIVKVEASVALDDASVEALQSSILEDNEKEAGEDATEAGGKGTDVEVNGVVVNDEDNCNGDKRSSEDQQPSPVLINGKVLDFLEETPESKDEPDLLSTGSNSISDAVSESSMQEVSSAPVKPFVPTEETLEASRPGVKPGFYADSNQTGQKVALPEDKSWSCNESSFSPSGDGSLKIIRNAPEEVEHLSQAGQHIIGLKHDSTLLNDDILHAKALDKENQIKFDLLSDVMDINGNSIPIQGKVSIKVNGLDEGITESSPINAKVLSNSSSVLEELDDRESVGECEHEVQSTREAAADFRDLQYKSENIVEPAHINGKVLLEECTNNLEAVTTDETSLQTGQDGTDITKSDVHSDPDLPAASELLGNKICVSSENDLNDGESAEEKACLECDTLEERVIDKGILEEPKLQPPAQNLDILDGTTVVNSVKLDQEPEPSSVLIASKGIAEATQLCCEGSTDNANREDMDDGLSGKVLVKDRVPIREQEIEVATKSCEPNDCVRGKELTSLKGSAHVTSNSTRQADDLVSKGAVHQHGLQTKGVSLSTALEYLPLEIGFVCLLIAIISYILCYLEVVLPISS